MNGITHAKPLKRLRLQLPQLLAAVIHRATDPPVLPPRVLHLRELGEFGGDLLGRPARAGEGGVGRDARARGHEFGFQVGQGFGDVGADAGLDEGES